MTQGSLRFTLGYNPSPRPGLGGNLSCGSGLGGDSSCGPGLGCNSLRHPRLGRSFMRSAFAAAVVGEDIRWFVDPRYLFLVTAGPVGEMGLFGKIVVSHQSSVVSFSVTCSALCFLAYRTQMGLFGNFAIGHELAVVDPPARHGQGDGACRARRTPVRVSPPVKNVASA